MEYLKQVLDATGIGGNRIHLEYCSAAEGQKFQHTATDITDRVLKLGPNPLKALVKASAK